MNKTNRMNQINAPRAAVLTGCGKNLWPRENFDGLQMWRKQ